MEEPLLRIFFSSYHTILLLVKEGQMIYEPRLNSLSYAFQHDHLFCAPSPEHSLSHINTCFGIFKPIGLSI